MANDEESTRIINRNWRVVRKIGQGGMGTVWEVRHKDIRKMRSAVKEIKANLTSNQEVVRRFLREVRLMAELEGVDHIVRVTEFDREEGFVFMTLVDGPSLAQIIERQGALSYEQVLQFGGHIAAALAVVHERGIVHRDIKPPNVLVDERLQKAYLTDFGIAKKLDLSEGDETIDGTLTLDGTLTVDVQYMGTPRYSSPEQLRVEYPPSPLWDIYAMGVLLYEAYSGVRLLPQFRKYHEFLQSVGSNPTFDVALPYRIPPPPSFSAIIEHCLQRDPAKRVQSAAELAARLQDCAAELHRTGIGPAASPSPLERSIEDQETLKEDFRDPRGELREEIERRFGALEEIEGTLVAVGLNLPIGPASETLGHALHDISLIEGGGQYQEALGRLEALREQAAAAHARAEQAARDGLEQRVAELDAARRDLERRAGRWLDDALLAPVEAALATARRGLADAQWKIVGGELAAVPEALQAAAEAADTAARNAVAGAVAEIAAQQAVVERLDAGAMPHGFDLDTLRSQVEAQLAAGQLDAAVQQAEAGRAIIAAAREGAQTRAAERVRAARDAVEQALAELDLAVGRRVAPDAVAELERARSAAAEAEAAGDLVAALAACADAERAVGTARARVADAQAADRRALAEALRDLVAEMADAPAAVVGEARAAAQAVIEAPPAADRDAVDALREAATRLEAARAELPAFVDASTARAAAEGARATAAELPLAPAERRRAEAALANAVRAFDQRQWPAAAANYAEALALWESLAAATRAQSEQEQRAALHAALEAELDALSALEGERGLLELPADDAPAVAALRSELEHIGGQERRGALDEARANLETLRAAVAHARAAHETTLRRALAAAVAALAEPQQALRERAGALLAPAGLAEVERAAAQAEAAIAGGAWAAARTAVADAQAALERVVATLRGDVDEYLRAQLSAIDADVQALAAVGGRAPFDPDELRARTTILRDDGQYAAVRQAVDDATAGLEAARAARERELAGQIRDRRAAFEATLDRLDLDAARSVAAAEVERSDRLRGAAAEAEAGGRYLDAISAYEQAAAAVAAAAAAVEARRRAELADLIAIVRETLAQVEDLSPALAEPARQAARAALEGADRSDLVEARRALQAADSALQAVRAETPLFAEAETRRHAAVQAQERLAQLPLSADEQAPALQALAAGAAAFERRAWAEARAGFDTAHRAFADLGRVGEERQRAARELAAKRAAARGALDALVERARPGPAEVVSEALRAAETLLGDADASLEALGESGSALAQALDEVPAHAAALERRAAADARQAQVAERRLTRRQLKPARRQMRRAAGSFTQRQWTAAGERYAEAEALFAELAASPARKPARWPYAVAAVMVLAVAVGALLWSRVASVRTAPVAPPPAAPAQVARIASAEPLGSDVTMNEGASQTFSIQLADATATKPQIEWVFAGQPVTDARGKTAWEYRPDMTASTRSPYAVSVTVGGGTADGQAHSWKVNVAHQNRPAELVKAMPAQGGDIKKDIGQTANFAVEANDPDGDSLTYAWTVDGQTAGGNQPTIDVPVERDSETVALAITDGKQKEPLRLEWKLTGREALWAVQPPSLKQLAFGAAQTFKLTPPGASPAGIQIAWAVNGQKVADGPSFLYQATNPDLVGATPVQVRATATDAAGKPFTKDWSFTVTPPPPPKVTGASPAAGVIEAASGAAQKLALSAAPPVSGQRFTYVFDVNGKRTTSGTPSVSVTPSDGGDTLVVAAIEDNFTQHSKETRWTIRPAPKPVAPAGATTDAAALVRGWLDQYRGALNGKDVATQCSLLELDASKCAQLTQALDTQGNLRVAFDNLTVEPQPDGRVRAQYTRLDEFVDPAGKSQSRSARVTQTFRLLNGKAQLDKSGQ